MNLNLNINLDLDSKNFVKREVCEKNTIDKSSKLINSFCFNLNKNHNIFSDTKIFNNKCNKSKTNEKTFYKNPNNVYDKSFQRFLINNSKYNTSFLENPINKMLKNVSDKIKKDSFENCNKIIYQLGYIVKPQNSKILLTKDILDSKNKIHNFGEKINLNKNNNNNVNMKSLASRNLKGKSRLEFYSNKTSYLKTNISNNKSTQITVKRQINNDSHLSKVYRNSLINSDVYQNHPNKAIFTRGK